MLFLYVGYATDRLDRLSVRPKIVRRLRIDFVSSRWLLRLLQSLVPSTNLVMGFMVETSLTSLFNTNSMLTVKKNTYYSFNHHHQGLIAN